MIDWIVDPLTHGFTVRALIEITLLAEKAGVTRADFLTFLNDSGTGSPYSRYKSPALINLDFTPTFTPVLLLKDMDLGLAAARELGVTMPVTAITREIVATEVNAGNVEQDFASMILRAAVGSGIDLQPEGVDYNDGLDPEA